MSCHQPAQTTLTLQYLLQYCMGRSTAIFPGAGVLASVSEFQVCSRRPIIKAPGESRDPSVGKIPCGGGPHLPDLIHGGNAQKWESRGLGTCAITYSHSERPFISLNAEGVVCCFYLSPTSLGMVAIHVSSYTRSSAPCFQDLHAWLASEPHNLCVAGPDVVGFPFRDVRHHIRPSCW